MVGLLAMAADEQQPSDSSPRLPLATLWDSLDVPWAFASPGLKLSQLSPHLSLSQQRFPQYFILFPPTSKSSLQPHPLFLSLLG